MPRPIKRGEIYWVDWGQGTGSEQAGMRPALIIQNDIGNEYGATTIIAPCTTAEKKPYPVIVSVTAKESGLPKHSSIDLGQIRTIAKSRLGDKVGWLSASKMAEVDKAIKYSLGLDQGI